MIERFYKDASSFVYVRISAEVTMRQLNEHVLAYNQETQGRSGLLELSDCRLVTSIAEISTTQLVKAPALSEGTSRIVGGRLAFVVPNALIYGFANAYAMFAAATGREVAVFYTLTEALTFLQTAESQQDIMHFIDERISL